VSDEPDNVLPFRSSRRPPADGRLARLARELGIAPPVFEGPLCAFQIGEEPGAEAPVFLGGDLHAVHPEARARRAADDRDRSLDSAKITIDDHEHETAEASAVEGIWCLALPEALSRSAPHLIVWDTEGRPRVWLLLAPARMMIGVAHAWLPQVPPSPPDS
jgi:hypothetical protein